ncbi:MAG: SurA N-terminal domain-containing protein [Alphaproteobacteria bacterium]|nr:SurA N-terminal domain-containing protein [Alphaproteobacteria bacterium]
MLQSLREQSGKWFVKVLFGAIIASFVIWGIGDVIRGYSAMRPIAKVGSHSITYDDYSHALRQEISRIQEASKGKLTSEQLKQAGIHTHVLDNLINQATLDQELKRHNLFASDMLVRSYIHSMPVFQQDGTFNKQLFSKAISGSHLTESQFIQNIRHNLLTQQLVGPLVMGAKLTNSYKDLLFKALTEEKVFAAISIPFEKIKLDVIPTKEELTIFYQQNKQNYGVPEFRRVTLVLLTPKTLSRSTPLNETDIQAEYDARLDEFTQKEQRSIKRLSYASRDQAEKALDLLKKGKLITTVIREIHGGQLNDLGMIEKSNLPDVAADAVFSLDVGAYSPVIETATGFDIYQTTKIEPKRAQPLKEVREKIIADLYAKNFDAHIQDIKNKIEDTLAGGASLAEVSKQHNLPIESVDLDQQGQNTAGKPAVEDLSPETMKLIAENAFTLNEGGESAAIDIPNTQGGGGGSFILRVEKITASHVPEQANIKETILKDWIKDRKLKEAAKLANSIAQNAKTFMDFSKLASQHGLTLTSNHTYSRIGIEATNKADKKSDIPTDLIHKGLLLAPNQTASGQGADGFFILMLQKTNPFTVDKAKLDTFTKNIDQLYEKDFLTLLVQSFRHHNPVSINQDILTMVINAE